MTTAFHFPLAQTQAFAELKLARQHGQGFPFDHLGAQTAQLPFPCLRKLLVKRLTDDEVEDGVAQKFQALVIAGTVTAMGQCQVKLGGVTKLVTQAGLQALFEKVGH